MRATLAAKLEALEAEIAELGRAPTEQGAQAQYGKRAGDHVAEAADLQSRSRTASQLERVAEEVRRGLENLDQGGYGRCQRCGGEIPRERLEALPWAVRCVACAGRR